MKILFLVANQIEQGTYWRSYFLARELVKLDQQVTVLAVSRSRKIKFCEHESEGVHIVESPDLFMGALRSGWDPHNSIRRIFWLFNKDYDLVHAFETRPINIYPALFAKSKGIALFFDWADWLGKGGSVEERNNIFVKILLRPVETYYELHFRKVSIGTTVINKYLESKMIAIGVPKSKVLLLRNGSNQDIPLLSIEACRKLHNLPLKERIIGIAGRLYEKDAQFVAQAINKLGELDIPLKLLLIGYFNREIEYMIEKQELVIRTGEVDLSQVYSYMAACDIFWLPLTNTGANIGRTPLKLNDYMSVGRPIIATDIGDIKTIIVENQAGIIVPANVDLFVEATISLIRDPAIMLHIGKQARTSSMRKLLWSNQAKILLDFYRQTLN
jgi:glycosyltransferase involved in cell wall biosynthesis